MREGGDFKCEGVSQRKVKGTLQLEGTFMHGCCLLDMREFGACEPHFRTCDIQLCGHPCVSLILGNLQEKRIALHFSLKNMQPLFIAPMGIIKERNLLEDILRGVLQLPFGCPQIQASETQIINGAAIEEGHTGAQNRIKTVDEKTAGNVRDLF